MTRNHTHRSGIRTCVAILALLAAAALQAGTPDSDSTGGNPVLEWNQIFIDTLIATAPANASTPRLGAIVHTAIFDAYNGIEQRYTPIFVHARAPQHASRHAAVIAAAYTTLVRLFPARKPQLDASYEASLAALDAGDDHRSSERAGAWQARVRGIDWGTQVAEAVLAWRATDGFSIAYVPGFAGGAALGQWRPVAPATVMSAEALAFTHMFVLESNTQFRPAAPRALDSATYARDLNAVKSLGRATGSTRTADETALAPFWDASASVHWNQAANQIARANRLSVSRTNRLLAVLNLAMADTSFTIWSAKRFYGEAATEVTWRPITSIRMADLDGNADTLSEADWTPLMTTPSHPEYPAGHPSFNGAGATVLLEHFCDRQTFTLTTGALSRTYTRITRARSDGNNARVWGGMHYPSSVDISDRVGGKIARYVNRNLMQPVHSRH